MGIHQLNGSFITSGGSETADVLFWLQFFSCLHHLTWTWLEVGSCLYATQPSSTFRVSIQHLDSSNHPSQLKRPLIWSSRCAVPPSIIFSWVLWLVRLPASPPCQWHITSPMHALTIVDLLLPPYCRHLGFSSAWSAVSIDYFYVDLTSSVGDLVHHTGFPLQ